MTDFYALLKQSILTRGIHDPAQRQAVYAQARSALIRQLASQTPRLSNADIAVRVIEFDKGMRKIEAELVAEANAAREAPTAPADAPEPAADDAGGEAYADAPEVEREASGWDVRDRAVEDDDAPIEPDAPPRPGRDWRTPFPSLGAIARRGMHPPAVRSEDNDGGRVPAPFGSPWKDEDAVLQDARADSEPLARRLPPPQRRLGWTLSEKDKVRVLIGAIGVLAVVLIGLLVFLFLPGSGRGVTLPIDPQGAVSDAAAAVRIAGQTLDVKQSFVVFDGHDPTVFQASSDNPVRLNSDAGGAFARVGTSTSSTGVKVLIGPGLAASLAGQNIRVVLTVRGSIDRGALNMRFAYQSGIALSHWQTANLTSSYAQVGMTWIVPASRTSPTGADYLLIEPGIPGDQTAIDIQSIRIDLLKSAPTT